jgi:replication factor A1
MSDEDIQPYIDGILEALSDSSEKVTREELEKELKKFLEYGVPLDHAKQTLIKKFGGSYIPPSTERILIVDLKPNQNSVNLLCRVITINPKDVTIKGEERRIFYGILADESGTIPFTAWNDLGIEKGTVIEISNAYTREWQGDTKLNLGDRTKVEKTDESKVPESSLEPREYKMKDLRSGLGVVEVTARILEINKREVEVDGQKKSVYSGILGDETGKAQYTSWHDFKLKAEDVVKISGGYVKSWKGIPQLTFDEKATVEKVDANKISKKDIKTRKLPLHELVERYGALDVEVEGTIIQIREGSGLVQRCPECNRVLQGCDCSIHGAVKGVSDLRIKLVIDDGTGAVSGIINKDSTEKLLGKTIDELAKMLEKSEDKNIIVEEINNTLFAHRINLQGNALGDEFGITIIVKDAKLTDIDIEAESEKLSKELEELQ